MQSLKNCAAFMLLAGLAASAGFSPASEPVYDERADAGKAISAAVAEASRAGMRIVLVFGANWCKDCRALDAQMHKGELASLLEKSFVVVKVDVGKMDRNLDIAKNYGVPVNNGIPALAVLDAKGKLLYAQDQGQFASAGSMSYESIRACFERWKP
jgi:protein disulfide-isomerase